jgi:hypothetical protein
MTHGISVNICRPGFGASCALCCGSHNYRASRDEIGRLFSRRSEVLAEYNKRYLIHSMSASRSNLTGSYYYGGQEGPLALILPPLFEDCPHCPFVGTVGDGRLAGCLLYPEDHPPELRQECFLSYRGKLFTCRARDVLTDEEILYAARLTGDWYYYSMLIHDEALLRRLARSWPDPADVPEGERAGMRQSLEQRIASDRSPHTVHSYFY